MLVHVTYFCQIVFISDYDKNRIKSYKFDVA